VTAVLVGDLWRWGMQGEAERGDLEKFWRQLVRWSVVDVPDRLEVQVSDAAGAGGRIKRVSVRVRGAAMEPLDEAVVKLEVKRNGASETVQRHAEPSVEEAGLFEAELSMAETGGYEVAAVVERPAAGPGVPPEALGRKVAGWTHEPLSRELADLWPDTAWLERVAAATGGRVLEWDELDQLPKWMKKIQVPVMDREVEPLWHRAWVFAVMLGLLVLEWSLRRRAGLP
jgi:hypothetical protein